MLKSKKRKLERKEGVPLECKKLNWCLSNGRPGSS